MAKRAPDLLKLYRRLHEHFGPQGWWPVFGKRKAHASFEICIGALLTQNTAWTNVEKALVNLHKAHLLSVERLAKARPAVIKKAIRPAGYFNQKAKKLQLFSRFIGAHGGLRALFQKSIPELREALLGVWGIGRETADSIILYAAKKPIFVVDAYTKRLLDQFGVRFNDYDEYRKFFETRLPCRVKRWNEYHALIVAWGKLFASDTQAAKKLLE